MKNKDIIAEEKKLVEEWKDSLAQYGLTTESVLELFGATLSDKAGSAILYGQVEIFDISPIDLKKCIKDGYLHSLKPIGKCRYGDWKALSEIRVGFSNSISTFLSEEEVSYEKREYEKFIDELREECTNSEGDRGCNETPCSCEFQPGLVLLFCDGKYIFTGVGRGPDLKRN
jgi:hypothetical protein